MEKRDERRGKRREKRKAVSGEEMRKRGEGERRWKKLNGIEEGR